MKKLLKYIIPVLSIILLIVAVVFVFRLFTNVAGGILNTVLGIVVIVALVLIVLWMFSYAKKHK